MHKKKRMREKVHTLAREEREAGWWPKGKGDGGQGQRRGENWRKGVVGRVFTLPIHDVRAAALRPEHVTLSPREIGGGKEGGKWGKASKAKR